MPSINDDRVDQSGKIFHGQARPGRKVNEYRMMHPAAFICGSCSSQTWRIICESHPQGDAAVYFQCNNRECRAKSPILQLRVLSLNDRVAKETGLWTPDQGMFIDIDLDDVA